tara:strand:- start:1783 stop:2010 length:228 start_codon:yes stop_codon:yes gene_type:complete
MALDKFIDMVLSESIYFTNAAKMTDKYEGAIPRKTLKSKRSRLLKKGQDPSDVDIDVAYYEYSFNSLKDLTLINC